MTENLSADYPPIAFAMIRVRGSDRISFLQGQLTQDLELLAPDKPLFAGWNTAKGRLICTCLVADWQDSVCLFVPESLATTICQRLAMFVLRADVIIEHLPDSVRFTSYNNSNNSSITNCYSKQYISVSNTPGSALTVGNPPEVIEIDASEWLLGQIKAGIPWILPETNGEFVAQMVNLDLLNGISFTKGCYVGQEIIARTHNLGRIKRRMFGYSLESELPVKPGTPIYNGSTSVGQVVCAAPEGDRILVTASHRTEAASAQLRLGSADGPELHAMELPYEIPLNAGD